MNKSCSELTIFLKFHYKSYKCFIETIVVVAHSFLVDSDKVTLLLKALCSLISFPTKTMPGLCLLTCTATLFHLPTPTYDCDHATLKITNYHSYLSPIISTPFVVCLKYRNIGLKSVKKIIIL